MNPEKMWCRGCGHAWEGIGLGMIEHLPVALQKPCEHCKEPWPWAVFNQPKTKALEVPK